MDKSSVYPPKKKKKDSLWFFFFLPPKGGLPIIVFSDDYCWERRKWGSNMGLGFRKCREQEWVSLPLNKNR